MKHLATRLFHCRAGDKRVTLNAVCERTARRQAVAKLRVRGNRITVVEVGRVLNK